MKNKTFINSPEHFFQVLRNVNSEPVNFTLEQEITDMCFVLFTLFLNKPKCVKDEQFLPYSVSEHAHSLLNKLKENYYFVDGVLKQSDKLCITISNFLGYTKFSEYVKHNS